ncbi:uncharacterized protein [Procambarus clarkii]|uniref:uncharacterized protein n=1 Tax=Procambarus clarkii TaxID=6728 RepID=UPI003743A886
MLNRCEEYGETEYESRVKSCPQEQKCREDEVEWCKMSEFVTFHRKREGEKMKRSDRQEEAVRRDSMCGEILTNTPVEVERRHDEASVGEKLNESEARVDGMRRSQDGERDRCKRDRCKRDRCKRDRCKRDRCKRDRCKRDRCKRDRCKRDRCKRDRCKRDRC